jgi:hypothetical protein
MFAGLFIVVAGAEKILLTPQLIAAVQQLHFENAWILSGATALCGFDLEAVHRELAGARPGLADRGDEFHLCRKPYFDRFRRQSHRRRTRQASGGDDLFSRLRADRRAVDVGEPRVWHLVALVTERRKYYKASIPRELVNRPRKGPTLTQTMRPRGQSSYSYVSTRARRAGSTVLSRRQCGPGFIVAWAVG